MNETGWFFEHEGAANALLSLASSLSDHVNLLYTQRYVGSDLQNNVTALKKIVGGMDITSNCSVLDISQRFDIVEFWKVCLQKIL